MIKELGSFEVTSGKLRVCDPCYSRRDKGVLVLENVLPGRYFASIEIRDMGGIWGKRVTRLDIRHENYNDMNSFDVGTIGVDSGQVGFYDDDYYPQGDDTGEYEDFDTFYGKACGLTLSEEKGGIIDNFGVVSSSGYGDGEYFVSAVRESAGWVVAASIIFIFDDEDEGDDYEED